MVRRHKFKQGSFSERPHVNHVAGVCLGEFTVTGYEFFTCWLVTCGDSEYQSTGSQTLVHLSFLGLSGAFLGQNSHRFTFHVFVRGSAP